MNELKIEDNGKETVYNVPSCFDEMSRIQFIETCGHALGKSDTDSHAVSMTGMEKGLWEELELYHRHVIRSMFSFTEAADPEISKQLLPFVEIAGQRLVGYQPNFSNTTWEEFIFADQYVMDRKFKEAAAVLYRPQRRDYSGETDRRVPFTVYGTDSRLALFARMDDAQLLAFAINYRALRKRNLEEKYPSIFSARKEQAEKEGQTVSFSWIGIHRTLMGDQFYDEAKFFSSNVHVILNRLNTVIRENRQRKR
ncbi:hypothetical protein LJC68_07340 [Bacteroidales bacterium OttesenSCG-928-B11]|nr:hypothetical protein [Bacteroidales bacterium OttesenSCG-928-B11]MDL2326470.1 hypothetical protein [Bacteroidales bacterium OttesenSCG-928-A14]